MAQVPELSYSFPKLSDYNYASWKLDVKCVLIDRNCWEFIIKPDIACKSDASDREKSDFEWRKRRAYTTIYQSIERKFQILIAQTESGKDAWDILKLNFEPTSRARLAGLVDEFFEMKLNSQEETIGLFCKKIEEKKVQIKDAGFEMPELLVCFQLIRRLPEEYDNLVQVLYRLDDKEFKLENVSKQLITEYGRICLKRKDEGKEIIAVGDAYATKFKNPSVKPTIPVENFGCSKKPWVSRSGSDLDPTRRSYTSPANRMGPSLMCSYCKRPGHTDTRCFKKNSRGKKQVFYSEPTEQSEFALMSSNDGKLVEFLLDSAATSHFTNDRSLFVTYKNLPPQQVLIGDKDCSSEILGIGDIDFTILDVTGNVEITLKNVLYAPNMRRNLIGGSNIDIAGNHIKWGNNKMIVYDKFNRYCFTVPRVDKLYIVKGYASKCENFAYSTSLNSEIVHRRFCHTNLPLLEKMSKNNCVKGIENINCKNKNNICESCVIAKSNRKSFKRNYLYKRISSQILDRVYMDLWGPSPVNSLGGGKYFLSIIDDYSRRTEVYIIKDKTEVFECFKKFLVKAERQTGKKLKCVRTDNGLEFTHKSFEKLLTDLGIRIERSSIYTPEQVGVAENFNKVAMNAVRAMLHDSGLKPSFWGEALLAFVHTKNRTEHSLTQGLTPQELWTGFKPSVRHLRIFGSLAFVHVPKVKRNKLQPKALLGILVGYAMKTKGYRIYIPKERRIVETIHVRIDESKKGVETLFGGENKYKDLILNFNESQIKTNGLNNATLDLNHELPGGNLNEDEEKKGGKATVSSINISEWKRIEKPRTKSKRIDVYYYTPITNTRLRSLNDVKKYCKKNKIPFEPDKFDFKPKTTHPNTETLSEPSTSDSDDTYLTELFQHEFYNTEIPKSFEDAQINPERGKWNAAMREELEMMSKRKVWRLVDPPKNSTIVGSKWVYNIKNTEKNGKKYKARLVAQGFKQKPGIDFNDIFSPVVNFSIIKLMFILLVSMLNWYHIQLDVKSAYLYGTLKETVFMKQPPGFEMRGAENKVCLLNKSIYGLRQSGREWNSELDSILHNLGFCKLKWCNCVYKLNSNAILVVYVDDLVLFAKDENVLQSVTNMLKDSLEITEIGLTKYLLGVNFEKIKDSLFVHQRTYIERLELKYKDLPKSYVKLPFKIGSVLPDKVNENEIVENEIMRKFPYRSLIGCLSFLSNRSRPDISFSVNVMSQFCNGYTYKHWLIVVDIMNYVFATKDFKINLSNVKLLSLCAYSDANWGCQLTKRHSSSGYIIYFGNVPFAWKSSKQKCIALSSMESEFISLTESVKELTWYSRVLNELNLYNRIKPIQYCDNESAIYFSKNSQENFKTKHIDIRCQFIRQLINENVFELKHVSSKDNKADFLTKPLLYVKFQKAICNIFDFDYKKKEEVFTTDGAACWKSGQSVVPQNLSCGLFGSYIVPNRFFFFHFGRKGTLF